MRNPLNHHDIALDHRFILFHQNRAKQHLTHTHTRFRIPKSIMNYSNWPIAATRLLGNLLGGLTSCVRQVHVEDLTLARTPLADRCFVCFQHRATDKPSRIPKCKKDPQSGVSYWPTPKKHGEESTGASAPISGWFGPYTFTPCFFFFFCAAHLTSRASALTNQSPASEATQTAQTPNVPR